MFLGLNVLLMNYALLFSLLTTFTFPLTRTSFRTVLIFRLEA
jgi:hypothetical protein